MESLFLVSEMTFCGSSLMLNPAHSLPLCDCFFGYYTVCYTVFVLVHSIHISVGGSSTFECTLSIRIICMLNGFVCYRIVVGDKLYYAKKS